MDPVYAGAIAGMVLLFGCFLFGSGMIIYMECRSETSEYEAMD